MNRRTLLKGLLGTSALIALPITAVSKSITVTEFKTTGSFNCRCLVKDHQHMFYQQLIKEYNEVADILNKRGITIKQPGEIS